jgi:CMP-N-acetylneuraminic acid synthetase
MSNIYGLSTARGGSKSVIDKNVMNIQGKPLYLHNVLNSLSCPEIKATYVTTDIEKIIEDAEKYGYKTIRRPDELCQDHSTHSDTIIHGLYEIEKDIGHEVDILVVMLGNTMNVVPSDITKGIEMLAADPTLDSVITLVKQNHFNPIRAYVVNTNDLVETYLDQDYIRHKTQTTSLSDKNSVGNIYFQNGLWLLRRKTIVNNNGILPFQWLGTKIGYIVQHPALQEIDDSYQINLLQHLDLGEAFRYNL